MRNRKLLCVLIPLIIVVLILIAGIVYLKLSSSPKKIFERAIDIAFEMVETSDEKNDTIKGSVNLTADIESENEQIQTIKTMLEGTSINLDMQADTANMIINESMNVTFNNESLLNAAIVLQEQKGYVYLKDYLDKYLEVPQENMEYSDLTEYYDNMATLDQDALIKAIKEELIFTISAQEFTQEDITLNLDGQETKVTASILNLKNEKMTAFYNQFFGNLNKNENFLAALGAFKEDVQMAINDMLLDMEDAEDVGLEFTIYTKGLLNEFVGISGKAIDNYFEEETGIEILKQNDEKYEFKAYNEYEGEREEVFNITVDNKKESKNKGTATITLTVEEEQFAVTYNYEKQGKQTSFVLSTEIEGVGISFSSNAIGDGKNVKGKFMISVQEETLGKANLNCSYDFTYGEEIQKIDTQNAVLIDELSEEDQTTLMTNLQNSALYKLVESSGVLNSGLGTMSDNPEVTYDGYTVKYTVPDGFNIFGSNTEDEKTYMDDNGNSIYVSIKKHESASNYIDDLEETYILSSSFYENQKISDTKTYTVNGKDYKYRTISYEDNGDSCASLYFAYELDDNHCYVVQVETGGTISMDIIKQFLDVTVE